jgi:hypothetical protein
MLRSLGYSVSIALGGKSVRAVVKEMSVLPLDAEADDLSKPNTE